MENITYNSVNIYGGTVNGPVAAVNSGTMEPANVSSDKVQNTEIRPDFEHSSRKSHILLQSAFAIQMSAEFKRIIDLVEQAIDAENAETSPDMCTLLYARMFIVHYYLTDSAYYDKAFTTIDEILAVNITKCDIKFYCTVLLTGGEPFVRHDILEIIEYCKGKGLQLIIYTNATLISDEVAIRLGQLLDKHDIMHVSLDSSIPEIHNSIRGGDCFDATLKGLKRLSDQNLTIRINVVPTSINIDSIWGIIDIAEKFHVKYFSGSPLMTIGRGKNDALVPDPQKMYALEKAINERMINSSVEFEGGISGALCTMYEFRHKIANDFPKRERPQRRLCDAGTRKLFIDALGNCYPCSLFALDTRFCLGNINESNLSEIWHNRKLSLFKNGVARDEKICSGCELWDICDGGCMALSFNHYGSLKVPDPRCKHVQELLER